MSKETRPKDWTRAPDGTPIHEKTAAHVLNDCGITIRARVHEVIVAMRTQHKKAVPVDRLEDEMAPLVRLAETLFALADGPSPYQGRLEDLVD